MLKLYRNTIRHPIPTLMPRVGVSDYEAFTREILANIPGVRFFGGGLKRLHRHGAPDAEDCVVGANVFVKISVTHCNGETTAPLVRRPVKQSVPLKLTAIFTIAQTDEVVDALAGTKHSYVSVFGGRIADTVVTPAINAARGGCL